MYQLTHTHHDTEEIQRPTIKMTYHGHEVELYDTADKIKARMAEQIEARHKARDWSRKLQPVPVYVKTLDGARLWSVPTSAQAQEQGAPEFIYRSVGPVYVFELEIVGEFDERDNQGISMLHDLFFYRSAQSQVNSVVGLLLTDYLHPVVPEWRRKPNPQAAKWYRVGGHDGGEYWRGDLVDPGYPFDY